MKGRTEGGSLQLNDILVPHLRLRYQASLKPFHERFFGG